jgi:hypothetical protein
MSTVEAKQQKTLFFNGIEVDAIEPTEDSAKDLAAARQFLADKRSGQTIGTTADAPESQVRTAPKVSLAARVSWLDVVLLRLLTRVDGRGQAAGVVSANLDVSRALSARPGPFFAEHVTSVQQCSHGISRPASSGVVKCMSVGGGRNLHRYGGRKLHSQAGWQLRERSWSCPCTDGSDECCYVTIWSKG